MQRIRTDTVRRMMSSSPIATTATVRFYFLDCFVTVNPFFMCFKKWQPSDRNVNFPLKREIELTSFGIFWSEPYLRRETTSVSAIWREIFDQKISCENWWDSARIHYVKTDTLLFSTATLSVQFLYLPLELLFSQFPIQWRRKRGCPTSLASESHF